MLDVPAIYTPYNREYPGKENERGFFEISIEYISNTFNVKTKSQTFQWAFKSTRCILTLLRQQLYILNMWQKQSHLASWSIFPK